MKTGTIITGMYIMHCGDCCICDIGDICGICCMGMAWLAHETPAMGMVDIDCQALLSRNWGCWKWAEAGCTSAMAKNCGSG